MSRLMSRLPALSSLCILLLPALVQADGTHGSQIEINNTSPANLCVHTFNGTDSSLSVPHKWYHIAPHTKETVKCHGENKNRCKVKIYRHPRGFGIKDPCKANDRTKMILMVNGGIMAEKDTCTYRAEKPPEGLVHADRIACTKKDSTVEINDPGKRARGGEAGNVKVHFKNCTGVTQDVDAFNGADGHSIVAYSTKSVTDGEGAELFCRGEGKKRCKLAIRHTFAKNVSEGWWLKCKASFCDGPDAVLSNFKPECD